MEWKEGDKEILPTANAWSTHVHFLGVNTKSAGSCLLVKHFWYRLSIQKTFGML